MSLSVVTLIARSACRLGTVGSLVHRLADCVSQLYDLWQSGDQTNSSTTGSCDSGMLSTVTNVVQPSASVKGFVNSMQ